MYEEFPMFELVPVNYVYSMYFSCLMNFSIIHYIHHNLREASAKDSLE